MCLTRAGGCTDNNTSPAALVVYLHQVRSVLVDDGTKGQSVPEWAAQVPDFHTRVAGARSAAPLSQSRRRGHCFGMCAGWTWHWLTVSGDHIAVVRFASEEETGNQHPLTAPNVCTETALRCWWSCRKFSVCLSVVFAAPRWEETMMLVFQSNQVSPQSRQHHVGLCYYKLTIL